MKKNLINENITWSGLVHVFQGRYASEEICNYMHFSFKLGVIQNQKRFWQFIILLHILWSLLTPHSHFNFIIILTSILAISHIKLQQNKFIILKLCSNLENVLPVFWFSPYYK